MTLEQTVPARAAALPRSAAAAAVVAEVADDPHALLRLAISGPSGSGKSTVLDDLAKVFTAAGAVVAAHPRELPDDEMVALLVDDAHELGDADLTLVTELVRRPDVHVAVAYRPWPQPEALHALALELQRDRPPLVLGPLTHDEIATYGTAVLGRPMPAGLLETAMSLTGGSTRYVTRFFRAVRDPDRRSVSLEALRHQTVAELSHLGEDIRELLLGVAAGLDVHEAGTSLGLEAQEVAARATAAGLLLPNGAVVPLVAQALLAVTPPTRVRQMRRSVLERRLADGGPVVDVALELVRTGAAGPEVAGVLVEAADGLLEQDPRRALHLYDVAVTAGADETGLAARRAQAAVMGGELDVAGRIVDRLLAGAEPPDAARAADVAAAVWTERGMLGRAAQTYRWLHAERFPASAAAAVVPLLGSGDRDGALAMMRVIGAVPPTVPAVAAAATAEGLLATLDGHPTRAMGGLVRASDTINASSALSPHSEPPAVLAALVALHSGEREVAQSVLDAAIDAHQGGPTMRRRLLLLRAWVAMLADRAHEARRALELATRSPGEPTPRAQLWQEALEVGLARRAGDLPGLAQAWRQVRQTVLHFPVDLYTLLPLCELIIAAARLRDGARLEAHVADAWELLGRLGEPAIWCVSLRWSEIQAAILTGQHEEIRPHGAALARAAGRHPMAAVLAAAAGAWLAVLSGRADPDRIEAIARRLASAGLPFEGSRLAGHAAHHAAERKDMTRLLACARELHPEPAGTAVQPTGDSGESAATPTAGIPLGSGEGGLSPREREVARLVLAGKTYREIGEAMYISPRTAEHHIARIRRRLGAYSRSDLLERLRVVLAEEAAEN